MTTYKKGAYATAAAYGIGTGVLMQLGIGYIGEKMLTKAKTLPGLTVAIGAYMVMAYAGTFLSVGSGLMVAGSVLEASEVKEDTDDVDEDTSE